MIRLEPFTQSDFDTFISWIDNEELLITIAGTVFSHPLTIEQLQTYLEDKNSHSFNIVDLSQGKVIGHAEIILSGHSTLKIDKLIIGDKLIGDKSNRGKGIGQEVINELLAYSFVDLGAKTVELNVFDWNIGEIRCYEKCGFVMNPAKQGTFRVGDKSWVALNMAIEKEDWENGMATGKKSITSNGA
jgi:RimJ/RimL family protein N-acetyltransferase